MKVEKAKGPAKPRGRTVKAKRGMFGDASELERLIELLENYAELAKIELTPAQLQTAHDNSALLPLERKLREALLKSGIEAWRLADSNEVMQLSFVIESLQLNELQAAYIMALRTVLAYAAPGEWGANRRESFKSQLKTIDALEQRDRANEELARFQGRKTGTISGQQKILRELITKNPEVRNWHRFWKRVLLQDPRIRVIGTDAVRFPNGVKFEYTSFASILSRARKALKIEPDVKKSKKNI